MQGKIYIISGPSGVGKGTIVNTLRKDPNLKLKWAKSYTTRAQRESDKNEDHYFFIDKNEFALLEKTGEILESNFYNNNWYGSSKSQIDKTLNDGNSVIKDIEVNGAMVFKKDFNNAVLIFIKCNLNDLKNRLINRGQNSDEEIEKRLSIAQRELSYEKEYDYVVINPEGHPEKAIAEIEQIIKKETNGL